MDPSPSAGPASPARIGLFTAVAILVTNMIGTGVFTSLGFQLAGIESPAAILLLWFLGGVTALCGAAVYGELGVVFPRSGGEYAKSLPVQWKGEDPDKDTLCYRLESSKDNGATWELLKDDLRDPSFTWDLSKLAEGPCLLRITASDRLSRPADPTETQTTIPITVDASAPVVLLLRQSVMVETDGRVTAQGAASDKLGAVRGVDWRVDSGGWSSAAFAGQVIEASQVGFSLTTGKLPAGKHSLEVRAFDRAGNVATDKVDLTVR